MFIQESSSLHKARAHALVAGVAGIGLWAIIGSVANLMAPGESLLESVMQCSDERDILAFQDRSRNGISLTCNSKVLSRSAAR